jgi:hypothetical protein
LIQTAHLVTACAQAIYLGRKKAGPAETALHAVTNHAILDLIPHAEPSFLGSSYLVTFTGAWWAAAIDNVIGWSCVAFILWRLCESRNRYMLPLLIGAWVPDFLVAINVKGLVTHPILEKFVAFHGLTHLPWKAIFSYPVAWWGWTIGITTTVVDLGCAITWIVRSQRPTEARQPVSTMSFTATASQYPATD